MNGAFLIDKEAGLSSFGVIEHLQNLYREENPTQSKRKDLPKLGHGGTLDPFATGLLIVLVGRAVKLARYFLCCNKGYEGIFRFGETTVPGDPTAPISETSDTIPETIEPLLDLAHRFTLQPYSQIPPMHSAKKRYGKPLYELARQGIEVERKPKICTLHEFQIKSYTAPRAEFQVKCTSGTYIRTLAQDFGKQLNSVALLETLNRTFAGGFSVKNAWKIAQIVEASRAGKKWDELACWVPFDRLLDGYPRSDATAEDKEYLTQGKQDVVFSLLKKAQLPENQPTVPRGDFLCVYFENSLIGVLRSEENIWRIERVFPSE